MNTERTIKTRKVWVMLRPDNKPIENIMGDVRFTATMAVEKLAQRRNEEIDFEKLRRCGYRVVRAELRYPVKGRGGKG